jgi:hypothetical protein
MERNGGRKPLVTEPPPDDGLGVKLEAEQDQERPEPPET